MPLETQADLPGVPPVTPDPDAACASVATPGGGRERSSGRRTGKWPEPWWEPATAESNLREALRACRRYMRRDRCWYRLLGTLPTQTPDTHGVWGTRESCGGGASWVASTGSRTPNLRGAALPVAQEPRIAPPAPSREPGAGRQSRTSVPQPGCHLKPPHCRLNSPLGSKLLERLPREVRGWGGVQVAGWGWRLLLKIHPLNYGGPARHRDNAGYIWLFT